MTFNMLKDDAQKMLCRSKVCPRDNALTRNLHVYPATMPVIIKSRDDTFADDSTVSTTVSNITDDNSYQDTASMHIIEIYDLVGRHFLINGPEDDQPLYLKIVKALETYQDKLKR